MTIRAIVVELVGRYRLFLLFATIGGLATFVDMGVLWLVLHFLTSNPYLGRVGSFLAAATFTWFCNRHITFRGVRSHSLLVEYASFLGVAAIGGSVNFAIYSALVRLAPQAIVLSPAEVSLLPYLGVIVGSLGGLVFNYAGTRMLVFKRSPHDPPASP